MRIRYIYAALALALLAALALSCAYAGQHSASFAVTVTVLPRLPVSAAAYTTPTGQVTTLAWGDGTVTLSASADL